MDVVASLPGEVPVVADIDQAIAIGSEVLVLGIAPPGGRIPASWYETIDKAINAGLSVVNGLHDCIAPRYSALSAGQWVWDIRREPDGLGTGRGAARSHTGFRLLTVGTDMNIGKMTTGLEVYRLAKQQGCQCSFVATGQIGISIMGSGVPLDAVRVDFASGAVEHQVLLYLDSDLIIIEGQGSILHPGSTAGIALLRGSCPTHLVLCHKAGLNQLQRASDVEIPALSKVIRLYEDISEAAGAYQRPVTVGISLNTSHILSEEVAKEACDRVQQEVGLPCVDPVRHGVEKLFEPIGSGQPKSRLNTNSAGA